MLSPIFSVMLIDFVFNLSHHRSQYHMNSSKLQRNSMDYLVMKLGLDPV